MDTEYNGDFACVKLDALIVREVQNVAIRFRNITTVGDKNPKMGKRRLQRRPIFKIIAFFVLKLTLSNLVT